MRTYEMTGRDGNHEQGRDGAMAISRVLMVDDEPDIRTIGELSLSAVGGFEVHMANDGSEAVAAAVRTRPDLILLDVMMPGLDGPSTLVRLRAEPATAAIPVIFMTAKVQKHEVARFMELGALGVVAKPFDPMTLPDELRRIVEAYRG
jgi:CheY-like chemotaxis protein